MRDGLLGILAAGALTLMSGIGCDKSESQSNGTSVNQNTPAVVSSTVGRVNVSDVTYASSKMGGLEMMGTLYRPYLLMEKRSDFAVETGVMYNLNGKGVSLSTNESSLYLVFSNPVGGIGDAIPFSGPNFVNGSGPRMNQVNAKRMVIKQAGRDRKKILGIAAKDPVYGKLFGNESEVYRVAREDGTLSEVYCANGSEGRVALTFRGKIQDLNSATKYGLLVAAVLDAQMEFGDSSRVRKTLCSVGSFGPRIPGTEGYWTAVDRTIDLWIDQGDFFLYLNRNGNPNRFEKVVFDKSQGVAYLNYPFGPKIKIKSDIPVSIDIGDGEIPLRKTRGLSF